MAQFILTFILMEMQKEDSPWGTYFGMFRDKFGV